MSKPKIMLVNVTHVEESRVAVVEDGVLQAYEIETISRTSLRSNIHNAVVDSVHPSLEAAFVKIGPDLNGFLPLDEVNFKLLPARTDSRKNGRIGQHLHQGQKIMAQVVREPFAGKPPTVSTYFSLPGRYLVLMPGVDSAGVSRKIEDSAQRDRLKKLIEDIRPPEGFGVIVRTAGMGQTKVELQRDMRYLLRLWESIQRASKAADFPALVYREADLVIRTIRDHFTPDIAEVWIDSEEVYAKALAFMRDVMPTKAKTLHLYSGERPLFNKFNLEEQIERIYKRRVPLPSGGEIVIDGTEALTAVDVNTARSRRSADLEENALQTNLEAAAEVARQLRLRDLGGLVVIDFIDMSVTRNKSKVEKAMRDAMRGDKAKYDITRLSKLGLMELARQRLKGAKLSASYATCDACDGYGLLKNVEPAALAALRKLQTRAARGEFGHVRVSLPPEVATWTLNAKREELLRIEQRYGLKVDVVSDPTLRRHEGAFETTVRDKSEPAPPRPPRASEEEKEKTKPEPPVEAKVPPATAATPAKGETTRPRQAEPEPVPVAESESDGKPAAAPAESGDTKSRRRRRRRRRPRASADKAAEPAAPNDSARSNGVAPSRGPEPPKEPETQPVPKSPEPAEIAVPRGVRSDELMPAAVGSAGGARAKRKSSSSGTHRRRKSGTRKASTRSRKSPSRRSGGD